MNPHRAYFPRDEAPITDGDVALVGWDARLQPDQLAAGLLSIARNVRCREGVAETRLGMVKPPWLHRSRWREEAIPEGIITDTLNDLVTDTGDEIVSMNIEKASEIAERDLESWGTITGLGVFKHPDRSEWIMLACSSGMWALAEGNPPVPVAVPAGVDVGVGTVYFEQGYNRLFAFRGSQHPPLVMMTPEQGFEYLVPIWDPTGSYQPDSVVRWGPWEDLPAGSVTTADALVTVVTPSVHGLITGQTAHLDLTTAPLRLATISKAVAVRVVDAHTFEFDWPGGAPTTSEGRWTTHLQGWRPVGPDAPPVADEPGVAITWKVFNLAVPPGGQPTFLQNRLLVPTSWDPGDDPETEGTMRGKQDYLVATDILDFRRFHYSQEFRINSGSDDELLGAVKLGPASVVALKTKSVHLLDRMSGDLSLLTLQTVIPNYGCCNDRAFTLAGKDLIWVSPRRGVISLQQTSQGQLQGLERTLSLPITPIIDRIDWSRYDLVRMAYWDSKLYVAVPLDSAVCGGRDLLRDWADAGAWQPWTNPGQLKLGQAYVWQERGSGDTLYLDGLPYHEQHVWTFNGEQVGVQPAPPASAVLRATQHSALRPALEGVNNAILVFDYLMGQWQSVDDGPNLAVTHFCVAFVDQRERLIAATADGYLNILEEADRDQVIDPEDPENGMRWEDIQTTIGLRAHTGGDIGMKSGTRLAFVLQSWATRYQITVDEDGHNEVWVVQPWCSHDRRRYRKPLSARRWDLSNVNDDFDRPWREDYSVDLGETGMFLGRGVKLLEVQQFHADLRLPQPKGRGPRVVVANERGRVRVRAMQTNQVPGTRHSGEHV